MAQREDVSHDSRRVPPPRTCRGGLDRRLLRAHRIVPCALAGRAGTDSGFAAGRSSGARAKSFPAILADIEKLILPGITHWQSPNFYAYFPSQCFGPGDPGRLAFFRPGVQGMLWATSPACTELETHVLDWLVHMLGSAAEISFHQQRRRRDPGHGFERFAVRAAGGAGAGHELRQQSRAAATASWWPTPRRRRIRRWRKARRSPASGATTCG